MTAGNLTINYIIQNIFICVLNDNILTFTVNVLFEL